MKTLETYILLFFIYSFLGWVFEVIISLIMRHKFINRGFLIGPYCPIYGYGVLLIMILLKKYQDDVLITFIMSMLIAGTLEYATSYFLEKIFNARWWDYNYKKFNINGRICLDVLISFGILACLIIYYVNPFLLEILAVFKPPFVHILVIALVLGYIGDNITSLKIMFNLKDVSRTIKDNTEEISNKVRKILTNKSRLYRRMVNAFPNIDTKVRVQEWKDRLNYKIQEKRHLRLKKRQERKEEIKEKIEELKEKLKDSYNQYKYKGKIIKRKK